MEIELKELPPSGQQPEQTQNESISVPRGPRTLEEALFHIEASHKAQLQVSRGGCSPGTCLEVLDILHRWRISGSRDSPVCWLSGLEGEGKSAIALTVANDSEQDGGLIASFFCGANPYFEVPSFLVLAVTYGLVLAVPELRKIITQKIATNPRILEASLTDQFRELVLNPLLAQRTWRNRIRRIRINDLFRSRKRPGLVIIDGLDDRVDSTIQREILDVILSACEHTSLRFLICSRPDSRIQEAFTVGRDLYRFTRAVELSKISSPDRDIEAFLVSKFQQIRECARFLHVVFPDVWPSEDDIKLLVAKSHGRFIYPATVTRFVAGEYSHPLRNLHIVLGEERSMASNEISTESPFEDLDALYHVILSTYPGDPKSLIHVLSSIILLPSPSFKAPTSPRFIEQLLGLCHGEVTHIMQIMHSVLGITPAGDIYLYNDSFSNFLRDESRAREYFINISDEEAFLHSQWNGLLASESSEPELEQFRDLTLIMPSQPGSSQTHAFEGSTRPNTERLAVQGLDPPVPIASGSSQVQPLVDSNETSSGAITNKDNQISAPAISDEELDSSTPVASGGFQVQSTADSNRTSRIGITWQYSSYIKNPFGSHRVKSPRNNRTMSKARRQEALENPADFNLEYKLPSLVDSVKSLWQASFQSAAVVSSLLAIVAAQLLAIISDDSFKDSKNPHAVDALFIISYSAVLFNASTAVTSLVLIDKLGRLLRKPAQRDSELPSMGYLGVNDHMSLLKLFAVGNSWIWYFWHWYITSFCGILCLFLQILLYFVLQNSKGVQIAIGIVWGFTVLPLLFVFL